MWTARIELNVRCCLERPAIKLALLDKQPGGELEGNGGVH